MTTTFSPYAVQHWSTKIVPASMRFDYWMSIMRTALWPVTDYSTESADFAVELQEAPLGCMSSLLETICAHRSRRTRLDVERTVERSYHLFVSCRSSWGLTHNGLTQELRPGDLVLVGEGEHETAIPDGFHGVILKCPVSWLNTRLPEPNLLVGRAISRDSRWGRVLSPMVSQLTPEFVAVPPLPHQVLTDQLGALLALTAGESDRTTMAGLIDKVRSLIRERCAEPQLTAADVAESLNIPVTNLHRLLGGRDTTFGALLLEARLELALPMLGAFSLAHLSIADIGRRAGFSNTQLFERAVRRRAGVTPLQLRPRMH